MTLTPSSLAEDLHQHIARVLFALENEPVVLFERTEAIRAEMAQAQQKLCELIDLLKAMEQRRHGTRH